MNVSITLTVDEANLILGALGKLPYDQSASLILKIKSDAEKQLAEKQKLNTPTEPKE